jgi:ring-1,2-phenylacetyl-CoA epoxidase subunit PaaE
MSKYYDLKVKEVINETADAVTIVLKNPLFSRIKYQSGQFLTLLLTVNGEKIRRSYSLSSSPSVDENMAITVKKVQGGLASNFLCNNIKAGDKIDFAEPMGHFTVEANKNNKRHIVLVGAGSGITPLMSMAKTILAGEPQSIVSLLYGNRNENNIIFKKQLEDMKAKYGDRFTLVHALTQPSASWNGFKGRIDKVMTVNVLNLLPKWDKTATEFYLCGPEAMMTAAQEGIIAFGMSKTSIFKESFTHTETEDQKQAKATLATTLTNQKVSILLDGSTYEVEVSPKSTILEAALNAGIDMPYSCQSGLCTACRGKCTAGQIKMEDCDGLSEKEIQQGYVLTCMSHPMTSGVVVEIG